MGEIGAPGVTRTPGTQFRKLLSVAEVLDISTAPSGLAGPRRAWTAAAASETRRRSAVANVSYQSVKLQFRELMSTEAFHRQKGSLNRVVEYRRWFRLPRRPLTWL